MTHPFLFLDENLVIELSKKRTILNYISQQDQNELMGSLVGLLHQQGLFAQGSEGQQGNYDEHYLLLTNKS